MKSVCTVCGEAGCSKLASFGQLPVGHHFLAAGDKEARHPLDLGQCEFCGVVQILAPIAPADLVPRFDWIRYNEPEAHLDAVVDTITGLPGLSPASVIWGISYKEDSTLERLRRRGYSRTLRLEMSADLGIPDTKAGVEMLQAAFKPGLADELRRKHGTPDVVIVRHVLEHTHRTREFLECFRNLVNPGGHVVFEIPDCERGFRLLDYTTLWEDHTLYFVEASFLRTLRAGGFSIHRFDRYCAAYENCLVAITCPCGSGTVEPVTAIQEAEFLLARQFAEGFGARRSQLQEILKEWSQRGRIVLFGAGHQSVMFLSLMGIGGLIESVIDDHPGKKGMRMPGTRHEIVGSEVLYSGGVALCLSSLGAESEAKVLQKHAIFSAQGGVFASIFPVKSGEPLNFLTPRTMIPAK